MGRKKGYKHSEETRKKIADTKRGLHVSPKTEFKKGCTAWNKGKKMIKNCGSDHPNWNGGSSRYWANKVAKQKNTCQCQICKASGKTEIHHINGNPKDNDLRNLGIVCSYCHFAIHDNGRKTRFGGEF